MTFDKAIRKKLIVFDKLITNGTRNNNNKKKMTHNLFEYRCKFLKPIKSKELINNIQEEMKFDP